MNTLTASSIANQTLARFPGMSVADRIDAVAQERSTEVLNRLVSMELMGDENRYVLIGALNNRRLGMGALLDVRFSSHADVAAYAHERCLGAGALVAA